MLGRIVGDEGREVRGVPDALGVYNASGRPMSEMRNQAYFEQRSDVI